MSQKNKTILISVFLSIALLGIILNIIEKHLPEVYLGDNSFNGGYNWSIPQEVYSSENQILESREAGDYLLSNYTGNILQVFYLQEIEESGLRRVRCDEYLINESKFTYLGVRLISFENEIPHTHSLFENIRADASATFLLPMPKSYTARPMWGVTDAESVQNMKITGQPVDDFIKFTTSEGKDYYLWIIDNYVGGDGQESIVIELE